MGTLNLRIPKLRTGSFFPEDVLERYQRVDRALVAAVAEMYATGTSTRKVQRIAEKMGIERLGRDRVSAIAATLDAEIADLAEGPLDARAIPARYPTSGSTRPTSSAAAGAAWLRPQWSRR